VYAFYSNRTVTSVASEMHDEISHFEMNKNFMIFFGIFHDPVLNVVKRLIFIINSYNKL